MAGLKPARVGSADTLRRRHVALSLALLAPALIVCALLLWGMELQARRSLEQQMIATARALSLAVDRAFGEKAAVLDSLATSPDLLRGDFAAFDHQARQAIGDSPDWVLVQDSGLRQMVNTRAPPGAPLPVSTMAAVTFAGQRRPGVWVTNLMTGPFTGRPVVGVSRLVTLSDGRVIRLSIATLASDFDRTFADQGFSSQWTGSLIDSRGVLVARSRNAARLRGRSATADMRAAVARSREGVLRTRTLDGIKTLSAYSRLDHIGWAVVVGVPRNELNLVGGVPLAGGLLLALALLGGGVVLATYAARGVEAPITALAEMVRAWRAGSPYRPPPLHGPSEVRDLAEGFAAALEALDRRETALRDAEVRLGLALEASGASIWEWDRVSGDTVWSPGLHQLLGHPAEAQDLAEYGRTVVHPEDIERTQRAVDGALKNGGTLAAEFRVLVGDPKTIRWMRTHASVGSGPGGPRSRLVGVSIDVTELRAHAAALESKNAELTDEVAARTTELDRIWRLSRDGFVISDSRGVWLRTSPAWTDLLGWTEEELVGRTVAWIEHPGDRTNRHRQRAANPPGEAVRRFNSRIRARSGEYRWISWSVVPSEGRFYSVGRDVTAEMEASLELERAQDALRQAQKMDAMGQLTGGVAHDFNNLLTPILGGLDVVRRRATLSDRDARLLNAAAESAERARILVQRLLAFARRQPLQAQSVELDELLRGAVILIESTVGPRIRVELRLPPRAPAAWADQNQLEMALLNLAVNARDAMPDGGLLTLGAAARTVVRGEIEGLGGGDYVRIWVSDTGAGMDEATLARAVEPFFSTKGIGKGTGLGLSMVHGLAAQLGGTLRISSQVGQGTTVELWLRASHARSEAPALTGESASEPAGMGLLLLVDDEALVRTTTSEMLAAMGYTVVEASGAREALRLIEGGLRPALVISDHLMPEMTGAELARELAGAHPQIPLLIVSGYAAVETLPAELPRLRKPFLQSELAAQVATLIRRAVAG
jgi:PAS domain S-box-containing protein